jgi:hypothetical protein
MYSLSISISNIASSLFTIDVNARRRAARVSEVEGRQFVASAKYLIEAVR